MAANSPFLLWVWVRFFFLFTPFFALSIFLGLTRGHPL
jgi:hypothetical protein